MNEDKLNMFIQNLGNNIVQSDSKKQKLFTNFAGKVQIYESTYIDKSYISQQREIHDILRSKAQSDQHNIQLQHDLKLKQLQSANKSKSSFNSSFSQQSVNNSFYRPVQRQIIKSSKSLELMKHFPSETSLLEFSTRDLNSSGSKPIKKSSLK
ncbi:Hypothetical_protein [Hexamita inflata]|uniref:Hypothetical_protein n=1 Tax=Hexamita inflata TaxID=28002 RepID=A0AA86TT68_9EUKA|nr:Hypothetical protein HINF_LOCUS13532 [Hexamita inflata]